MAEIREALIGFAMANGHLPCPAISATDGAEDRVGSACKNNTRQGFIPWVTLGVPRADAWSRLFHYSVTLAYSNSTTRFDLTTARDITIKTRNAGGGFVNVSNADDIPAVVLSHGKNGYGATLYSGVAFGGVSATNVDEQKNVTGDGTGETFIFREQSDNTSTSGGEFDDLVVWLSPNILFNRMVAAGKLP